QKLATTGSPPPSLQGASMTFDDKNHVVVLAGGLRHQGQGAATLSQVWVFDPSINQWDETDGGDAVRRRDHMAAYNAASGEHILFGGRVSQTVGNFYDRGVMAPSGARLTIQAALPAP